MITLDGSVGEAGGQILRTALALSGSKQEPFTLTNIRANRPQRGLTAPHLGGVRALQELCDAEVHGAELGSTALTFKPHEIKKKQLTIDIKTAGSLTLLLQTLLLPCVFAKRSITLSLKGGTDVAWSPQFEYWKEVIVLYYRNYAEIVPRLQKRGYYPKGGGEVEVKIKPKNTIQTPCTHVSAPHILQIKGRSHASSDLEQGQVAERMARSAEVHLTPLKFPINIQAEYKQTESTGCGITLYALYDTADDRPLAIGADVLGEKGIKAEEVGKRCAQKLQKEIESRAPIDEHTADHLIPLLGLVKGAIHVSTVSEHTKTNIAITEQFLGVTFDIDEEKKIIAIR